MNLRYVNTCYKKQKTEINCTIVGKVNGHLLILKAKTYEFHHLDMLFSPCCVKTLLLLILYNYQVLIYEGTLRMQLEEIISSERRW